MNKLHSLLFVLPLLFATESAFTQTPDPQMTMTKTIIKQAMVNGKCYDDLGELCSQGPRLTGSDGAEKAAIGEKLKWNLMGLTGFFFSRLPFRNG